MSYQGIQDLEGNPLTSLSFALHFEESKEFDVQVFCRAGGMLKALNGTNVFYFGRFDGGDPWADLEDGLDLTPFNGTLKVVHIKVETDEETTPSQQSTSLFLM